jgi:hypothetical protein
MPEQSAEKLQKSEISKEGQEGRKNLREDAVRGYLVSSSDAINGRTGRVVKLADASFESGTREDACGIRRV